MAENEEVNFDDWGTPPKKEEKTVPKKNVEKKEKIVKKKVEKKEDPKLKALEDKFDLLQTQFLVYKTGTWDIIKEPLRKWLNLFKKRAQNRNRGMEYDLWIKIERYYLENGGKKGDY